MSSENLANSADVSSEAVAVYQQGDFGAAALVDLGRYHQSNFDAERPKWYILLWWIVQALVFPLTVHSIHGPRRALLRLFGAQIGKHVVIRPTARFTYPWKVEIGDYSWIGDGVTLYSLDRIRIGQHCVISQKSYLCTGSHDPNDPHFGLLTAPITVQNGVWIATDCFVSPGVCIGANSIVGARSSVFSDLPTQQICFGNPCRARRPRSINLS